jgi:thiamine-phosphate pyrophosphorylase
MSDAALLAWGRAAAARQVGRLPVLWLFTDTRRLPDPRPAAARLPVGISGVVLRHDDHPDRAAIGRDLARICRRRRLALVVAGDSRLAAALGAGVHLRGGHWPGAPRHPMRGPAARPRPSPRLRLVTSSAHDPAQLRRARRNGAALAFLSPAFPTASHPGEPALGAARWTRLARFAGLTVVALGGIDGRAIRRLRHCGGAAAIGALAEG